MDGQLGDVAIVTAIAAPITVGLVQGAKASGMTSARWAVAFAILCGILIDVLVAATDLVDGFDLKDDIALVILLGIITGLSASGLYSGGKAVVGSA
jgi:hypothetical protein